MMKHPFAIVVVLACHANLPCDGQEVTIQSTAARSAQQKFANAVDRLNKEYARDKQRYLQSYLEDLQKTVRLAARANNIAEANAINAEIKRVTLELKSDAGLILDPRTKTRRALEGTHWTWKRPGDEPKQISLKPACTAIYTDGSKGAWALLDAKTALLQFGAVFVVQFDDKLTSFRVLKAYTTTRTKFSGGDRIK